MRKLRNRELKQIARCHMVHDGAVGVWFSTPASFVHCVILPINLEHIMVFLEVMLYVVADCTLQKWPHNYIDVHMLL